MYWACDNEVEGGGGELLSAWRSSELLVTSQEASPPSSSPTPPSTSPSMSPSSHQNSIIFTTIIFTTIIDTILFTWVSLSLIVYSAENRAKKSIVSKAGKLTALEEQSEMSSEQNFQLLTVAAESWKMASQLATAISHSYRKCLRWCWQCLQWRPVRSFPSGHSKVSTVTPRVTLPRGLHTRNSHSGRGSTFVNMG